MMRRHFDSREPRKLVGRLPKLGGKPAPFELYSSLKFDLAILPQTKLRRRCEQCCAPPRASVAIKAEWSKQDKVYHELGLG